MATLREMATANGVAPPTLLETTREATVLAEQWRRLARAATAVAILTSPAPFLWFWRHEGWGWYWALLATFGIVVGFRALVDLVVRRLIPWPSLFGTDDARLHEADVTDRRRAWFWRFWVRVVLLYAAFVSVVFNFAILLGPLLFMGISQIRGYEPGDAEWGVRLADVRGQAEAKEEVRRVVTLWQSGEAFERAGGKRERGILFLGAPGTG